MCPITKMKVFFANWSSTIGWFLLIIAGIFCLVTPSFAADNKQLYEQRCYEVFNEKRGEFARIGSTLGTLATLGRTGDAATLAAIAGPVVGAKVGERVGPAIVGPQATYNTQCIYIPVVK